MPHRWGKKTVFRQHLCKYCATPREGLVKHYPPPLIPLTSVLLPQGLPANSATAVKTSFGLAGSLPCSFGGLRTVDTRSTCVHESAMFQYSSNIKNRSSFPRATLQD